MSSVHSQYRFGKEMDGLLSKLLVEFMDILVLNAMFVQFLHFPKLKAAFSSFS